jgi:hypothetical protein
MATGSRPITKVADTIDNDYMSVIHWTLIIGFCLALLV